MSEFLVLLLMQATIFSTVTALIILAVKAIFNCWIPPKIGVLMWIVLLARLVSPIFPESEASVYNLVLLAAIVFSNSISANIYYGLLDQCFQKTHAVSTEINTRIHLLDDGTVRYIALLGNLDKYDEEDERDPKLLRELGPWKFVPRTLLSEMFLYTYTDFNLSYYRQNNIEFPKAEFNRGKLPVPKDWDLYFPTVSDEDEHPASAQVGF